MKLEKKGSMTKKVFYGALILLVIGLVGTFISFRADNFSFGGAEVHQVKNINNEKIEKLSIKSSSTDVEVQSANRKDIKIELMGHANKNNKDDFQIKTTENGRELLVTVKRKGASINFGGDRLKIVVTAPKSQVEQLKVESSSGDLKIHTFTLNNVELNASSGDVQSYDMDVKELLTIHTNSGDIKANDNEAKMVTLQASSGDITGKSMKSKSFHFNASSGDIILQNLTGDIDTKTGSGDVLYKQKDLSGNVNIQTGSGDSEIRLVNTPKSVKLDFHGGSGDGNVKLDGLKTETNTDHKIVGQVGNGEYEVKVRTGSGDFTFK